MIKTSLKPKQCVLIAYVLTHYAAKIRVMVQMTALFRCEIYVLLFIYLCYKLGYHSCVLDVMDKEANQTNRLLKHSLKSSFIQSLNGSTMVISGFDSLFPVTFLSAASTLEAEIFSKTIVRKRSTNSMIVMKVKPIQRFRIPPKEPNIVSILMAGLSWSIVMVSAIVMDN